MWLNPLNIFIKIFTIKKLKFMHEVKDGYGKFPKIEK